eukprot:COSAG06_NODE_5608_length_3365_cov_0.994489_4_plen_52_part_00
MLARRRLRPSRRARERGGAAMDALVHLNPLAVPLAANQPATLSFAGHAHYR